MAIHRIHNQSDDIKVYGYKQRWLQLTRPLTLTGTMSPIIAGTLAASYNGTVHLPKMIILIIAAVLIQAAINILNDYFDFKNGQDKERWLLLIHDYENNNAPRHKTLPIVATIMLTIAMVLGIWLAINSQPLIILIGIVGILAGYKYSAGGQRSLSALGLGEVTAAIFLGVVPVMLSFIVQKQSLGWMVFIMAAVFAVNISIMILTNNTRDIEKDKGFRETIAIRIGKRRAVLLLIVLAVSVYVFVTLGVLVSVLPWTVLLVYFAIPVAYQLLKAFRKDNMRAKEMTGMKRAAQHHWLFSGLFIMGMILGL